MVPRGNQNGEDRTLALGSSQFCHVDTNESPQKQLQSDFGIKSL